MNLNKKISISLIIILVVIITSFTAVKVYNKYRDDLYQVVNKKIISAAKKCYYDEKCLEDKILLKDLYDLKYLEKVSDPVTKEYYNENSYVKIKDNNFEFIPIE